MSDTPETRAVIDAAAQAAAAGDHASAEQCLREAARLQEAKFGPLHPELASTLNNLGVVSEIMGKPVDAERYFRQAAAVAAAVLPPDHPSVTTSRKNLEDFCAAQGRAVDAPAPPPAIAAERDAREASSASLAAHTSSREAPRPVVSWRRSRSIAGGALIAGSVLATFMAAATWFRSADEVELSPGIPSKSPSGSSAAAAVPPNEPAPVGGAKAISTSGMATGAEPGTRNTASTRLTGRQMGEPLSVPPAAAESQATSVPVPRPPLVAGAHLCRDLQTAGRPGDWHCVPPSLPIGPGPLFFYTRLKSPVDTTVRHLWYRGDRLRQIVELRIRANTTTGYRTYSRSAVDPQGGAGDWRVELRTIGGALLHEERFVVR